MLASNKKPQQYKSLVPVKNITSTLAQAQCRSTALKVALVVGTVLFTINHGSALLNQKMDRGRWTSGVLTYMVPFLVSIHGQSMAQRQRASLS